MPNSRLHGLAATGQSVWSDQISRSLIDSGELTRRVTEDAVSGVTSNPTIFANAISNGHEYDRRFKDLVAAGHSDDEVAVGLMTADIQDACDILRSIWEWSDGGDGYVSVEVSPLLAGDIEATVEEAREWVKRIDRPNLYVKVPATQEGVGAIRQLISEGISINVTLIFSLKRYEEIIEAYQAGLEEFAAAGGRLKTVNSVASFFVSRVDTEVDKRLEAIGTEDAMAMRGTAAIANALRAYELFLRRFRSDRWLALAAEGGRLQRPLWASTSTKNPAYPDTMYVEKLVAPHTVDTMPLETIDAYQDHGLFLPTPFGVMEIEAAAKTLERLASIGIDMDDVTDVLEREGVEKFSKSWHELLAEIVRKRG